jgi:aldose sugar dehydrogenase
MSLIAAVSVRTLLRCTVRRLAFAAVAGSWIWAGPGGAAEEYGIAPVKVGAGPFCLDTAEQHDIRVDVLARGLAHAYSLVFLPNADALVVERGTRLRRVRNATGQKPSLVDEPVAGIPNFAATEHAGPDDVLGIQDIALHPEFASNHLIYYTFNRPAGFDPLSKRLRVTTVLARARLEGSQLVEARDLVVGEVVQDVGGSRILFGQGNLLYVSVGAISSGDINSPQRTNNIYGKVLRVRDDGSIPDDNPFVAVPGARGEIYSLGHRDPLGLTLEARSGSVIASEHGPQGGDKINRIVSGRNYGWPEYTYGTEYEGSPLPTVPVGPHTEPPLLVWMPSIAPSGVTFYSAERFPAWKNNLFVASARRGEIDRTGSLLRVVFNDKLQEIRQESLLESLHQRMRDVRQGPDGLLYVLTDEDDSVLLRVSPVAAPARGCHAP